MARSRKRKKTISQQLVSAGTLGLPAPVQSFLSSRAVAGVIVLAIPVLLASGIVGLSWENGLPRFTFNRQRAKEVEAEAVVKLQEFRQGSEAGNGEPNVLNSVISRSGEATAGFVNTWQREESTANSWLRPTEGTAAAAGSVSEAATAVLPSWFPPSSDPGTTMNPDSGPLSGFRQQFESRR